MTPVEKENNTGLLIRNGFSASGDTAKASHAGIFPVCKPEGATSFRMVQLVRRSLDIKKVGHTGTLDPFASGVLIICAGRPATKIIPLLMAGDKEYEATLQLGVTTDTQDPEGTVIERRPVSVITDEDIAECLERFTGEQLQTPPRYSALKHKGKPLYFYARKGIKVEKEARLINIKKLHCVSRSRDTLTLRVVCSKGTYIRTLAADIGEFLGCGSHLRKLKRTRNGIFSLADTLPGEKLFDRETAKSLLENHRITVDAVKELLAGNTENN
ncbi:MAG: tRNA pseudouridine(55) synthase TruB [Deltaproteobacteria bacterium]|jgi:tRNA pseudouridine55 synthase|nr:tRNA pseudouridine(55) synthase TruB [Deltaproteobacteria bacterium]